LDLFGPAWGSWNRQMTLTLNVSLSASFHWYEHLSQHRSVIGLLHDAAVQAKQAARHGGWTRLPLRQPSSDFFIFTR